MHVIYPANSNEIITYIFVDGLFEKTVGHNNEPKIVAISGGTEWIFNPTYT